MHGEQARVIARSYLSDITFGGWYKAQLYVLDPIGSIQRIEAVTPDARSVVYIDTTRRCASSSIANGVTYY